MNKLAVKILFFARAAELAGTRHTKLNIDAPADLTSLRQAVLREFPQLEPLEKASRWAVNEQFVDEGFALPDSDSILEIALIPPVSGG